MINPPPSDQKLKRKLEEDYGVIEKRERDEEGNRNRVLSGVLSQGVPGVPGYSKSPRVIYTQPAKSKNPGPLGTPRDRQQTPPQKTIQGAEETASETSESTEAVEESVPPSQEKKSDTERHTNESTKEEMIRIYYKKSVCLYWSIPRMMRVERMKFKLKRKLFANSPEE